MTTSFIIHYFGWQGQDVFALCTSGRRSARSAQFRYLAVHDQVDSAKSITSGSGESGTIFSGSDQEPAEVSAPGYFGRSGA
jgi:hypothetical protein